MTAIPVTPLTEASPTAPIGRGRKHKRPYSMERRAVMAAATKTRIRDAALALHSAHLFEFTLDEVARRAGVSVQTVLRIYGSKDALYLMMTDAAANRQRLPAAPGDVPAAVAALCEDYEAIGDQVIQYLADELRLPALKPKVELGRRAHRQWIETAFAPQLRARRGRARDDLLHALSVATDVYAWKLLRRDLKLDRRDVERMLTQMIAALT
ncbi:MAG TPA: helix-turn-helix domain-containing protein [Stellaceae bacterium]|nr:helix-turn-helix domain-containing protein [Stellaceae bacterium]